MNECALLCVHSAMMNLLLLSSALAAPKSSVAFSFDPHFANLNAQDAALEGYGFAPVGGRFLPMYGVRGRLHHESGLVTGMVAEFGFGSQEADGNPVPTTTSWTKLASVVGVEADSGLGAELDIGFGSLTHTVGSAAQGGALLYLGPYVHPRLRYSILTAPSFLEVSVGWLVHVPVSTPHQQPLWEEPFSRGVIHGPSVAITVGMGGA